MLPIGRTFVNAQVTVDSSAGAAAAPPRVGTLTHPGGDGRQRQQQQAAPPGTATADPFVTLSDWKLQVCPDSGGEGAQPRPHFPLVRDVLLLTCILTYVPGLTCRCPVRAAA